MRFLTIIAVGVLTLSAQYAEVVTTSDGQDVYFTTQLVLKDSGDAQRPELRLFHIQNGKLYPAAERGSLKPSWTYGSGDGVQGVSLSNDGQTVAFTLHNICPAGEECRSTVNQAKIRTRWFSRELGNNVVYMSRNAEWALLVPPSAPEFTSVSTLVNLRTDDRIEVTVPPSILKSPLASDGSVLVERRGAAGGSIGIQRGSQFSPLALAGAVRPVALSDSGRVVVLSRIQPAATQSQFPRIQLVAYDVPSGQETVLYAGVETEMPMLDGLSNDGRVALVRVQRTRPEGDMFVVSGGRAQRVALGANELGVAGAISGDGSTALIATSKGRLLRMRIATGAIEELIPETPSIVTARLTPGALIELDGPAAYWQDRINVGEKVAPVIRSTADRTWVQFPWEADSNDVVLRVETGNSSPLEQKEIPFVTRLAPSFLNGLTMIRGDWSGFQSTPPGPGEIVHAYMSGLGPVIGEVQTGVPAPLDALRPIEGQLRCRFNPHQSYAETLWAGLAPGMIGIYQVTFRMPPDAPAVRWTGATCDLQSRWGNSGFSMIGVPLQP